MIRPRKIKMPTALNPECIFMAKTSKNLLARIKLNLLKLCELDKLSIATATPTNHSNDLLKWKSKYHAEVLELCSIEIAQIEGINVTE